jgi:hypothetical protein
MPAKEGIAAALAWRAKQTLGPTETMDYIERSAAAQARGATGTLKLGEIPGKSADIAIGNWMTNYAARVLMGEKPSLREQLRYAKEYGEQTQWRQVTTPDGKQFWQRPVDLHAAGWPRPQVAAQTGGAPGQLTAPLTGRPPAPGVVDGPPTTVPVSDQKKPKSQAVAANLANARSQLRNLKVVRQTFFTDLDPKGNFTADSKLNRSSVIAGNWGIPLTDARSGNQALRRAIETMLRLRTGAAAPEHEVKAYTDMYGPSVKDDDRGAIQKLLELQDIFEGAMELMVTGSQTDLTRMDQYWKAVALKLEEREAGGPGQVGDQPVMSYEKIYGLVPLP